MAVRFYDEMLKWHDGDRSPHAAEPAPAAKELPRLGCHQQGSGPRETRSRVETSMGDTLARGHVCGQAQQLSQNLDGAALSDTADGLQSLVAEGQRRLGFDE